MSLNKSAKIDRDLVDMSMDKRFYYRYFLDTAPPSDLAQHYIETGWRQGLDPAPWFSSGQYVNLHPELVGGSVSPFVHYLVGDEAYLPELDANDKEDVDLVEPLFDQDYYLGQLNSATRIQIIDPIRDYLRRGWKRGLNPTRWFSTSAYLLDYPDVAKVGINPFLHYLRFGRLEGRSSRDVEASIHFTEATPAHKNVVQIETGPAPEEAPSVPTEGSAEAPYTPEVRAAVEHEFSVDFYLSAYPDVAAAAVDPLDHYMVQGWKEGRDPSPNYSTQHYVDTNPDVIAAGLNPFFHYVVAGKTEGRTPRHQLGFRFDILRQLKSAEEQIRITKEHAVKRQAEAGTVLRDHLTKFFEAHTDFVLSFSHDDFTSNIGGVQLMLRREMRELATDGFAHINLFPAVALPFVEPYDANPILGMSLNGILCGYFSSEDIALEFAPFADGRKGDKSTFVVHHLLGHNLGAVVHIINALGFKEGYYWLHDYAALYNKWNLMRNDVQYGGPPKKGGRSYELCIYNQADFDHSVEFAQLFDNFKIHLISPSQSALNIWVESGQQKTHSQIVLPHCELIKERPAPSSGRNSSQKLRVGYLGFPVAHKGWPVFRDLVLQFGYDDRYEFHYLGAGCPAGLPITFKEVWASEDCPYTMRDAIAEAELDVVFAWSICPETFSLVAYEAIAGGALLIASRDGGNIPAIIKARECGLVVEDEASLSELMRDGAFLTMHRANRQAKLYDISFSRMLSAVITDKV